MSQWIEFLGESQDFSLISFPSPSLPAILTSNLLSRLVARKGDGSIAHQVGEAEWAIDPRPSNCFSII